MRCHLLRRAAVVSVLSVVGFWGSESVARAQNPPEEIEYYATDALGSVRIVFSPTGQVLGRSDYLPFGETLNQSGALPRQRFTGQERDGEAGLDYFNARNLQARTGRMNAPDPLFGDAITNPQDWNRYAYVRNSPLAYIDPTGMQTRDGNSWTSSTTGCTTTKQSGGFDVKCPASSAQGTSSQIQFQKSRDMTGSAFTRSVLFGDIRTTGGTGGHGGGGGERGALTQAQEDSGWAVGVGYNLSATFIVGAGHTTDWTVDSTGSSTKTKANEVSVGLLPFFINAGAGYQFDWYWNKAGMLGDYSSFTVNAGFLLPSMPSFTVLWSPGASPYGVSLSVGKSLVPQVSFSSGTTARCKPSQSGFKC